MDWSLMRAKLETMKALMAEAVQPFVEKTIVWRRERNEEPSVLLRFEPAQCEDAQEEFAQLQRWVTQAAQRAAAFDEVERHLFRKMLGIGWHVMVSMKLAMATSTGGTPNRWA